MKISDKVEEFVRQNEKMNSSLITDWNREMLLQAIQIYSDQELKLLGIGVVSKRYFLFECINADGNKLKKLIIAPDRETAIVDIEMNYPYIVKWFSTEELNAC